MDVQEEAQVGFGPEEIRTGEPTRSARLKWVVMVDTALPAGRAANSAVCVAGATVAQVRGLLGPAARDAAGGLHPGLPWAGCTVLGATADQLTQVRAKAMASPGVFLADMPLAAQQTRVYDEYLQRVAATPIPRIWSVARSASSDRATAWTGSSAGCRCFRESRRTRPPADPEVPAGAGRGGTVARPAGAPQVAAGSADALGDPPLAQLALVRLAPGVPPGRTTRGQES